MSDQTSLESLNTQATPEQQAPQEDNFSDLLKTIVNEDGKQKYDSVDKALNALKHAQEHIPQLKTENEEKEKLIEELKEKVTQQKTIEEVVEQLKPNQPEQPADQLEAKGLDEEAVLSILRKAEDTKTKQENETAVVTALQQQFGEKTKEALNSKLSEIGMDFNTFKSLSQTSPKAALQLVSGNTSKQEPDIQTSAATKGNVNISGNFFGGSEPKGLQPPEKSLMNGATQKDQLAYLRQIREHVYQKHGVVE